MISKRTSTGEFNISPCLSLAVLRHDIRLTNLLDIIHRPTEYSVIVNIFYVNRVLKFKGNFYILVVQTTLIRLIRWSVQSSMVLEHSSHVDIRVLVHVHLYSSSRPSAPSTRLCRITIFPPSINVLIGFFKRRERKLSEACLLAKYVYHQ